MTYKEDDEVRKLFKQDLLNIQARYPEYFPLNVALGSSEPDSIFQHFTYMFSPEQQKFIPEVLSDLYLEVIAECQIAFENRFGTLYRS